MSNQASLFAENTPEPYNPEAPLSEPKEKSQDVAGAAYQIPVFWMFCFDEHNLVEVRTSDGTYSTFVSPSADAKKRLEERDRIARDLFPVYVSIWEEFRRVIARVDRKWLKLDPCEIWAMGFSNEDEDAPADGLPSLGGALIDSVDWLEGYAGGRREIKETAYELAAMFGLAGLSTYDFARKTFTFDEASSCAERYLYGWLEMDDVDPITGESML